MLFLSFHLDRNRYLLDVREVIEVLPLVEIMQIPGAPRGVAGIFNYRGALVPAVDLSQVILGRPARERLHTRIVLAQYTADGGATHRLGLIAERTTETLQRESTDFTATGICAPHLGTLAADGEGLAQRVDVSRLLPPSVRDRIFQQAPAQ